MTKYIRLFKKGMYRFCMMFLLILISSGCNVKEIETQTQTETNNQYAVQEPEMTVIDGINYITEQGIKLKVTYPIISKDIADGNLVGTYMVNPVKLGNGLGEKDEMAYIVAGIIEWPSLYNDENIKKLEYTAYNASCIFDYSDMSENKYTKKQMDIKGETKTIYENDENKLKLIIINELPTSDKAAYSYMQPEYVEIKSVIDDINKMIVGVHVYYMDGSEDSDYYRVESISKSDISRIQIYRL